MLQEIRLSGSAAAWGLNGFVDAISVIAESGYDGVECSSLLVGKYEDRLHVFEEILSIANIKLSAMMQHADLLNPETADEEVERVANTARFLSANGSSCLLLSPRNVLSREATDDEWTTFVAILEEMSARCTEFEMTLALRPRAGAIGSTEKEIKRAMEMTNADKIKICMDTSELALADVAVDKFVKSYSDRLAYVRLRDVSGAKTRLDFTSNKPGAAPQFGRGAVDFEGAGGALEKSGYNGWISVEIAGENHTPKIAVQDAYNFVMRKTGLFL